MLFLALVFVCNDFFSRTGRALADPRLRLAGHLGQGAPSDILSILFLLFFLA